MPFTIVCQDITSMKVDAIVTNIKPDLRVEDSFNRAIFIVAGEELQRACLEHGSLQASEVFITPGFNLPAKYIIHMVEPSNEARAHGEKEAYQLYFEKALQLAARHKLTSIAFALVSTGPFTFSREQALSIASATIQQFLKAQDMDIYLVLPDKSFLATKPELIEQVGRYIDNTYIEAQPRDINTKRQRSVTVCHHASRLENKLATAVVVSDLEASFDLPFDISQLDEPFSDTLLRLIDIKGKTDVEVYKRANIDRKLFSKIRNGKSYTPSKLTAIALAIALELDLEETVDLLKRAGYALSHSKMFDVIVEYFILQKNYDIYEINEVLFHYDQPLLGA